MDSTLIAKILAPRTTGKNAIGTAYPISKDLVLTARHVVDFEGRDTNQPISIIWPDIVDPVKEQQPYTVTATQDNIEFFDGYDIALINCIAPAKAHVSPLILSERQPIERESWKSMGYAQVGKDNDERKKVSAMGDIFPPDACSHVLDLESRGDAKQKEGWKGISGAPVFRGDTLIAVLTDTPENINERLRAVSVSYLLENNPGFKKTVGFLVDAQKNHESYSTPLPDLKLDAAFKKLLHEKISAELQRPEAIWLNKQLAMYFGHQSTADLIVLITASLLNCQVDEAICKYLAPATTDCILATGKSRLDVGDKADLVRQVAEQILGWLVLASIDDTAIQKVWQHCSQSSALFFKLGVDTFAGVEIVLSRGFNRKTDFPNETSADPVGRYVIPHQKSWLKYDAGETVRKILIEIWNKVFLLPKDQKNSEDKLKEKEIKRLNAAIKSRRGDLKSPEHYYIAFELSELDSEFDETIYHELLKSLKDMTVVQFGANESDGLFLIAEEEVTTAIDEFYRAINGLKGQ